MNLVSGDLTFIFQPTRFRLGEHVSLMCTGTNMAPGEALHVERILPNGTVHTITLDADVQPFYLTSERYRINYIVANTTEQVVKQVVVEISSKSQFINKILLFLQLYFGRFLIYVIIPYSYKF